MEGNMNLGDGSRFSGDCLLDLVCTKWRVQNLTYSIGRVGPQGSRLARIGFTNAEVGVALALFH